GGVEALDQRLVEAVEAGEHLPPLLGAGGKQHRAEAAVEARRLPVPASAVLEHRGELLAGQLGGGGDRQRGLERERQRVAGQRMDEPAARAGDADALDPLRALERGEIAARDDRQNAGLVAEQFATPPARAAIGL